ncbi:MAG: pyrophosphate--fructose-6-phosphate 1-phosphotransferase [Candidatus Neomarinimicrobiota bacterium]
MTRGGIRIAFLTSGGLAPCLSASIGALIQRYVELDPDCDMMGYLHGYRGLLLGQSITISEVVRENADILKKYGGSPIGNSRVNLTNVEDCVERGFVKEGEDPFQVAADQLMDDGVTILHTIGGDDTNTVAAQLSAFLAENQYDLTVVGLPKTVDNDIHPITQSLGALTAAEQGAIFFENIVNENTSRTRQLIVHEIMGRQSGWLTAATAREYRSRLERKPFLPELLLTKERWDIDAVYIPESPLDLEAESERLRQMMDRKDGVNIFLSEGAATETIVEDLEAEGKDVKRDSFGHVALDHLNPGEWFSKKFAEKIGAEKVLVQKSGYFARSAIPNEKDLDLIEKTAGMAAHYALNGKGGVVGLDQENNDELSLIGFSRIEGGKRFDFKAAWFRDLLREIGQS